MRRICHRKILSTTPLLLELWALVLVVIVSTAVCAGGIERSLTSPRASIYHHNLATALNLRVVSARVRFPTVLDMNAAILAWASWPFELAALWVRETYIVGMSVLLAKPTHSVTIGVGVLTLIWVSILLTSIVLASSLTTSLLVTSVLMASVLLNTLIVAISVISIVSRLTSCTVHRVVVLHSTIVTPL